MDAPKPIGGEVQLIAEPSQFEPSRPEMKVVGTHNPGTTTIIEEGREKTLLMLRKTEQFKEDYPSNPSDRVVRAPFFSVQNRPDSPFQVCYDEYPISLLKNVSHRDIQFRDRTPDRLLHISYPVIMILDSDGNVERTEDPSTKKDGSGFYPCYEHERFGIEDIRITQMQEGEEIEYGGGKFRYLFKYTPPHRTHGVMTCIGLTNDFRNFVRVAPSPNETPRPVGEGKDRVLFPRRIEKEGIDGVVGPKYCGLMRPSSFETIGGRDIHLSFGQDFTSIGPFPYRLVESAPGFSSGPGPAPIELKEDGIWLVFGHQIEETAIGSIYRTMLLGLDLQRPWEALYKSPPLIQPNEHCRRGRGYVNNVNYVMGAELRGDGEVIETLHGANDAFAFRRMYYRKDIVKFLKNS